LTDTSKRRVFDDSAIKVMGEAFDAACKDLNDTGQPDIVYEVVATRIIEAAKSGERDPECQGRKASKRGPPEFREKS
jgi:hypothetical protein